MTCVCVLRNRQKKTKKPCGSKGRKIFPPKTPAWLKLGARDEKRADRAERRSLTGGAAARDVALWFMLGCLGAAAAGAVTHRDVVHSYAVVALWVVLHHQTRKVTVWGGRYWTTLLFPSAALAPLEYAIPLADPELAGEDLAALGEWRAFIIERCGVALDIEA